MRDDCSLQMKAKMRRIGKVNYQTIGGIELGGVATFRNGPSNQIIKDNENESKYLNKDHRLQSIDFNARFSAYSTVRGAKDS
jgi:hypothetical protein